MEAVQCIVCIVARHFLGFQKLICFDTSLAPSRRAPEKRKISTGKCRLTHSLPPVAERGLGKRSMLMSPELSGYRSKIYFVGKHYHCREALLSKLLLSRLQPSRLQPKHAKNISATLRVSAVCSSKFVSS